LAIFLEYEKDLNVRGKNKKEKLVGILSSFQKTGDELLLGNTLKVNQKGIPFLWGQNTFDFQIFTGCRRVF
jgi:hypothetical protein